MTEPNPMPELSGNRWEGAAPPPPPPVTPPPPPVADAGAHPVAATPVRQRRRSHALAAAAAAALAGLAGIGGFAVGHATAGDDDAGVPVTSQVGDGDGVGRFGQRQPPPGFGGHDGQGLEGQGLDGQGFDGQGFPDDDSDSGTGAS